MRELNENNTKKFIEERKRRAVIHSRQLENLQKQHGQQVTQLTKELERVGLLPPSAAQNLNAMASVIRSVLLSCTGNRDSRSRTPRSETRLQTGNRHLSDDLHLEFL